MATDSPPERPPDPVAETEGFVEVDVGEKTSQLYGNITKVYTHVGPCRDCRR